MPPIDYRAHPMALERDRSGGEFGGWNPHRRSIHISTLRVPGCVDVSSATWDDGAYPSSLISQLTR